MDPKVFWFNVVPAIVAIPIAVVGLVLNAPFWWKFIRARDWGGVAALVCGEAIMCGFLFLAIHTIFHPPIR